MSTEKHDQPAAPQGSTPDETQSVAQERPEPSPDTSPETRLGATPPAAPQAAVPQPPAPPAAPQAPAPQPVQTVSAPQAHPQQHPTQELHPQQHPTAQYPYAAPQHPYGQYAAPGYHGGAPYGVQPAPVPPRGAYPQQGSGAPHGYAQQGQGAAFGAPGTTDLHAGGPGGPGVPGEPGATDPDRRKARGWVPMISVAVVAALLASGGTALAVGAFGNDAQPASITQLGDPGRVDTAPVQDSSNTNPDWTAVAAAVQQSVVAIQTTTAQGSGLGSGLVLDAEGHILTNNHVVSGANDDTVQVTLSDGRVFSAKIVGADATTDLAVVKLENAPDNLVPVALGDSNDVAVGDAVLAVGNPLGLANTATTGIVSALDRPVVASGENTSEQVVTNAIQIDAAINPGNSGGPLFNAQGQVIGITSSIATLSGGMGSSSQSGSIGLGFAIPVNLAKNISDQLIENGTAQHAFLGVSLNDGTATADGVTRRGALVGQVTADSPAAKAGIQSGDVIVAIGKDPVTSAASLTGFVREFKAGQSTTVTLVRDGKALSVDVTLAVRDESATQQQPQQQQPQQPGDGSGDNGSDQGGSSGGSGDSGGLWDWLFPGR